MEALNRQPIFIVCVNSVDNNTKWTLSLPVYQGRIVHVKFPEAELFHPQKSFIHGTLCFKISTWISWSSFSWLSQTWYKPDDFFSLICSQIWVVKDGLPVGWEPVSPPGQFSLFPISFCFLQRFPQLLLVRHGMNNVLRLWVMDQSMKSLQKPVSAKHYSCWGGTRRKWGKQRTGVPWILALAEK